MERDRTFPPTQIHWSELKWMGKSPKHFRAAYETPKDPSAGMKFGTLVHALILGSDDMPIVFDGKARRGKAWDDFEAKHAGRTIVTATEFETADRVARAVRTDPVAAPYLIGLHERQLTWMRWGRKCGGRIDVIGDDFVADLKTTTCAEPGWFARNARRMGYHAQLAHYFDGVALNGYPVKRAVVVAVETSPPYDVVVFPITERALEEGRKLLRIWTDRVAVCEESGEWPGYAQSPVDLDIVEDAELEFDTEDAA